VREGATLFDPTELTVSDRVTLILGEVDEEPVVDLLRRGLTDTVRDAKAERVPEALREKVVELVGDREIVVEPVAVFEEELVRVSEGLPETDLVILAEVLADIVTVAERLVLGETDAETEGD
jgi:hypothetical protein